MDKELLKTLLFFTFTLGVFVGVGVTSLCLWITLRVAS